MSSTPYQRHRLNCSLSEAQCRSLTSAAKQHGAPATAFLRDAALAYMDQRYLVPPDIREQLASVLQESRRIGTNLNQIAAKANSMQKVIMHDLRNAKRLVRQLETHVHSLESTLQKLRPHT